MTIAPTPAVVALARRLYLEGEAVKAICAECGLTTRTMYQCVAGRFDDGSGNRPEPLPRRRGKRRSAPQIEGRDALVARMWRTAERQVAEIEDRLKAAGLDVVERENNVRIFAIVARTLRDLSAVDEANKMGGKEASNNADDDAPPRNIDELRSALADKLAKFVAARTPRVPDQPG